MNTSRNNKWVQNLTLVGVPSPLKTEVSHDSHWLGCLKPVPVSEYLNLILVSKKTLFFSRGEYFYFIWKTCKNIWILVLFVQKYSCWCFSCKNNHWDSFRAKILVFIVCFNFCRTHRVPTLLWLSSSPPFPPSPPSSATKRSSLKHLYFHGSSTILNILYIVG